MYSHGLYISEEKLNTILSLPREALIQDLELVLKDSIDRFVYFEKLADETGWGEKQMNIVVHSLFLLGELKATKSSDAIINVLSQSEEYLELYLGDFLTELMWEVLYNIPAHDLEACKQFVFKPGTYIYARSVFFTTLAQISMHEPERRDEVIGWFNEVIQLLLETNVEEDENVYILTGGLIIEAIKIKVIDLLPEIEKLFECGIVDTFICGDWKGVCEAFNKPSRPYYKMEILSIVESYKKVISTWPFYQDDESIVNNDRKDKYDSTAVPVFKMPVTQPIIRVVSTESKIGRNDPCGCGSGKKYKKCCLNG